MKNNRNKNRRIVQNRNKKLFRKKVKRNRAFRKKKRRLSYDLYSAQLESTKRNEADIRLFADENFKLLENTQTVIDYIATLKNYKRLQGQISTIFIDLSRVKSIDIGSISLLLSSIKELNIFDINIRGNLPVDSNCKNFILNSGYLDHMSSVSKKIRYRLNLFKSKNLILMSGYDKSENKKVGECIKGAIGELTGTPSHYPAIYGIIQEMNGNSVEHAYRKNKHWVLGINSVENKIIFTFTDNGYGILKTLKRRFSKKLFDNLNLKNDEEILQGVFDKEYNSRFKKQYNRNKGLPVIKKAQVNKKVNNLLIITNGVYLNIENNLSFKLNNSFSGTFYYWELDLETYNNGYNKN